MTDPSPTPRPAGHVTRCTSCGMPMHGALDHAAGELGRSWCRHCADDSGGLQPFEVRFDLMVQWSLRHDGVDRAAAEARTMAYLRTMPAWRDHPRVSGW